MNKLVLFLVGLIAFLVFVAAMIPASLAHRSFQEEIANAVPDLSIHAVDGTVWQGQGEFQFRQFPTINAAWDVATTALLIASLESDLVLTGEGLDGNLTFSFDSEGGSARNASLNIQDDYLNEITVPYGLDLSGEVQLEKANVSFNQTWLTEVEGQLRWSGGIVHIQTPEKIHTVDLPALEGQLSMEDSIVNLDIRESGNNMMHIKVKPDGWAEVSINYAFMDMAGLPLPANARTGSDPAIILEEKIL